MGMVWLMMMMMWVFGVVVVGIGRGHGGDRVTYDGRSVVVNGHRQILFSASIHYPRSTPDMWPSLIGKAKEGGVDVIETYVFWNLHQPQPSHYDFIGRNDLVRFMKEIQAQGLYAFLRIGPFVESEWTYGGFPFWLHDVPGIVYRSDNEPFKVMISVHLSLSLYMYIYIYIYIQIIIYNFEGVLLQFYMQNFTTKIVNLMKSEKLYASQGGPIILSQIENEYGNVEAAFREKGPAYVRWAAKMAVDLQTGVPWVMCKQPDAPDPVINTCNGMRCGETFPGPNSPNKPKIWTENWTSFYQVYGGEAYIRSAEDIAFHVALFIAKNGSFVNYYMYHGGTNFGRSGAAYVITSYYDQAPLDEYGLIRQPKWGHLKELHGAIKLCSTPLLQGVPTNFSLGKLQEAYVFEETNGGRCVAFLVNYDPTRTTTIKFRDILFKLLPRSISILSDCRNLIFNTAKVNVDNNTRIVTLDKNFGTKDKWEAAKDLIPSYLNTRLRANKLLEHMNTTKDKSDYLWYTFRFEPKTSCSNAQLHVQSLGHVGHAFVNNNYAGGGHGSHNSKGFRMEIPIMLNTGTNNISILSVLVGLPDSGPFLERRYAGLSGVQIQCSNETTAYDFSDHEWGYQVGMQGEKLGIYEEENLGNVEWSTNITLFNNTFLTWYKTTFDAPSGEDPVAVNLGSMGKGEAWVNGESIGRYWVSFLTPKGLPSQTLYHIPRSFLNLSSNLLVVFEESGGDPLQITLNTVSVVGPNEHVSLYKS